MFGRIEGNLPYGSTVLVRVDPQEQMGQDFVPVVVARKAPSPWDPSFASDGMFVAGDVMVWIHDLKQTSGRSGRTFEVAEDVVSNENCRAVPLASIASVGMPMAFYMRKTEATSDGVPTWTVKSKAIRAARKRTVLMSVNPNAAFRRPSEPLSSEDEARALVSSPLFPLGSTFLKGFKAPVVIRHRRRVAAWSGRKVFKAVVTGTERNLTSRRFSYKLRWDRTTAEQVSAGVPEIVDEGCLERYDRERV